jgi:C1A family cysteine protease
MALPHGPLRPIPLTALGRSVGTGWLPPRPDLRDYTPEDPGVADLTRKLGFKRAGAKAKVPARADLRDWCSPVEDQGRIGSCTANAAVGVVEYFERRSRKQYVDGSRLFVYKTTRNLMGVTGDEGAYLRTTMGALVLCGLPAEKYWKYTDAPKAFDREPTPFVYAVAHRYGALKYFCHDPLGKDLPPADVLASVKTYLAAGVPAMFGFYGFGSFEQGDVPGAIPYPDASEQAEWGHAVVAVGYDDKLKITNLRSKKATTGALLIRNSWGPAWGDKGYGWLPYAYVQNRLATDFWSLLSLEWVDTEQFGL